MTKEELNIFSMKILPHTYPNPAHVGMTHQWWCQQNWFEFERMILEAAALTPAPKIAVEIGCAHGGNLCFFDQLVGQGGLTIGIDPTPSAFTAVRTEYSQYERVGEIIYLFKTAEDALQEVKDKLNGRPIDFLFIDGDHSYEGVTSDFELYSPLVRSGGLMGFHDVAEEPGSIQFFDEVQGSRKEKVVGYMGTGLLWK